LPVCQNADPTVVSGVIRALVASEASLSILSDFAVSELVEIGIPADFARGIHDALAAAPTGPQVNRNRASHARTQFPEAAMQHGGERDPREGRSCGCRSVPTASSCSCCRPERLPACPLSTLPSSISLRGRCACPENLHTFKAALSSSAPPTPVSPCDLASCTAHSSHCQSYGQVARLVEEGQRRGLDMRACIERQVLWPSSLFLRVVCKSEFYAMHFTWAESVVWQDLVELLCRPSAP
jgi:hypothetical protein